VKFPGPKNSRDFTTPIAYGETLRLVRSTFSRYVTACTLGWAGCGSTTEAIAQVTLCQTHHTQWWRATPINRTQTPLTGL